MDQVAGGGTSRQTDLAELQFTVGVKQANDATEGLQVRLGSTAPARAKARRRRPPLPFLAI
jgi:hypothetical protein